jgi:hypothetical protein
MLQSLRVLVLDDPGGGGYAGDAGPARRAVDRRGALPACPRRAPLRAVRGRVSLQNTHSTDVQSPPPPPCVCVSIQSESKSAPILVGVVVEKDPGAGYASRRRQVWVWRWTRRCTSAWIGRGRPDPFGTISCVTCSRLSVIPLRLSNSTPQRHISRWSLIDRCRCRNPRTTVNTSRYRAGRLV